MTFSESEQEQPSSLVCESFPALQVAVPLQVLSGHAVGRVPAAGLNVGPTGDTEPSEIEKAGASEFQTTGQKRGGNVVGTSELSYVNCSTHIILYGRANYAIIDLLILHSTQRGDVSH